jgi:hypothetical protein
MLAWFAYFRVPNATDPLLATAQQVERLGLDYVAVQDHPYQRRFVDTCGVVTDGTSEGTLRGPVGQWVDELTALSTTASTPSCCGPRTPGQLPRFAHEVVPAVRAQVARHRGTA